MSNPIAKISGIVGAALPSHLLLLSKKGRQPSTSPSLITGIKRKNMSQIYFAEGVAIDLVCFARGSRS
jgi:hypothetical protein